MDYLMISADTAVLGQFLRQFVNVTVAAVFAVPAILFCLATVRAVADNHNADTDADADTDTDADTDAATSPFWGVGGTSGRLSRAGHTDPSLDEEILTGGEIPPGSTFWGVGGTSGRLSRAGHTDPSLDEEILTGGEIPPGSTEVCNDTDQGCDDAEEVWYDGVDQDCDGNGVDQDCDGNGVDQDCDGFDLDDDCDDLDASVNPDATEAWHDEYYDLAVQFVAEVGKTSTSMIQRHLKIGYVRAALLVEQMVSDGHARWVPGSPLVGFVADNNDCNG